MLISFTGPQSSGKSTLLEKCRQHYGDKFTYVPEVTRQVMSKGFVINEKAGDMTQLLIINSHIENSLLKNAILDRCALDGFVYTEYLRRNDKVSSWVADYASRVSEMLEKSYDIVFYVSPEGVPLVNDGVRSVNTTFRNRITEHFEQILHAPSGMYAYNFVELTGSIEERMTKIKETISNYEQRK